jgi:citrate lyase subunit beta/citryl-CoA lyase/(S)-citramalyl-CoA lyase
MSGTVARARRSLLFAPGSRAEVHAKALDSGADLVCLDLEDAVPLAAKAQARARALPFLSSAPGPERVLRINSPRSAEGLRDLLAVIEARPSGGTLCLPKVAEPGEVRLVADLLDEAGLALALAVLIEGAEGLARAEAILAQPRVAWAMFGGIDYAAEMGLPVAPDAFAYARARLLHAARLAGVDLLDAPCLAFRDEAAVAEEARLARRLGLAGKACLHPANVAVVNRIFTPSAEDVAKAKRIVALYEAAPNGLAELDGKLIERPVVLAMRRLLAQAGAGT